MTIRQIGVWIVALLCAQGVALAESGPSDESRFVARHGAMPFYDRYLYPGGGVAMSLKTLSLPEERIMVLTFDDGPDSRDLAITALLAKQEIPATFFYVGSKVRAMSEIVQEVMAGQHEIGFHSLRHQRLSWFAQSSLDEEFRQGRQIMDGLGITLTWFRPPYGDFNDRVVRSARQQGMETLLWTIDSRDWAGGSAKTIAERVIRRFHPGAVLLFHSTRTASLQALPEVLKAAEKEHYRFVTLAEWRRTIQAAHCRLHKDSCAAAPPPGDAEQP
ncbi:MAG: polysaccharide deacetylase family protein [Magnetococcus sp. MYC-9]